MEVRIYTPSSPLKYPLRMIAAMLRDVADGRALARQLAIRDLQAQYRQAALGLMWAFILPLANTAAWLFIQSAGVVDIKTTELPYPIYVFTGTMLWSIFMDAVNAPLKQTTDAAAMLAKINFPREALVLSGILQTLVNALIKIVVLLAALAIMGVNPGTQVLLLPLAVMSLILAGTALGLLVTPIGLLYTDVGKGLPLLLQFLMYVTPVVFAMPSGGWSATVFQLNPLTPLILTSRAMLTGLPLDHLGSFLMITGLMGIALVLAMVLYRAAMPILIERMSA